ncbi:MAG: addiction module protein [Polyangiaceae bacterium]
MITKMASERVRKILAEAAELPVDERATLVRDLARTLPDAYDADDPEVDYSELDRRMASVRSGSATLVPWEEARKELISRK